MVEEIGLGVLNVLKVGVLKGVDVIFGLYNDFILFVGMFGIKLYVFIVGVDCFEVYIYVKGAYVVCL